MRCYLAVQFELEWATEPMWHVNPAPDNRWVVCPAHVAQALAKMQLNPTWASIIVRRKGLGWCQYHDIPEPPR